MTMTDHTIVARALAAKTAADEARQHRAEAKAIEMRAAAFDAIACAAEKLGLPAVAPADLVRTSTSAHDYQYDVPLTPDATLRFTYQPDRRAHRSFDRIAPLDVRLKPCDQLYYDLPPGCTRLADRPWPGYTYGCHGLTEYALTAITTLAQIGEQIVLITRAREAWRRKHGLDPYGGDRDRCLDERDEDPSDV